MTNSANQAVWRQALVWGAYPVLVFGSIGVMVLGCQGTWLDPIMLGSALVLAVALLIMACEQLVPDRGEHASWRTIVVDLLHNLINGGGLSALVRAVAFGGLVTLGVFLSDALGRGLWPTHWSLLAQFVLAAVLGEFGSYWAHRLMHRFELMWRIHALHHSPPHLYMLASGRSHPFNAVLVHFCQVGPLVFLGAGAEVVALFAMFTAVTGLLQHANSEMRTEWLNWLFATPDLHRTHHSVVLEESNTNFGNNLIVWDVLFGTRLPGITPAEYGVAGVDWPEGYLGHLATPFTYGRISREVEESELEREPALV